jgi:hypothetical protein
VADVGFEFGGHHRRPLHAQQLLVALLADEAAVLLECGHREDALSHFLVADGDAEALGFG